MKKVTINVLKKKKASGEKVVAVTAYDYWQAQVCNELMDWILVGDSLGMTTLGYSTTVPVTMDDMLIHAKAVDRGASIPFKVGDMPFGSYEGSNEIAIENAQKFIRAGMDCIKFEGCMPDRCHAIDKSGILVMGHLGLTPQTIAKFGGYIIQGKTDKTTNKIIDQAKIMEDAGMSLLLLEAMPPEAAEKVTNSLSCPVYGIGAGDRVDGQLVIFHDLTGLFFQFVPKFVKRYCDASGLIKTALSSYSDEVRTGKFPSEEYFYKGKE